MVKDPCLPLNLHEHVNQQAEKYNLNATKQATDIEQYHLIGTGRWEECFLHLKSFVNKSSTSSTECLLNSTNCDPKPAIASPPGGNDIKFYGFSEFWYSIEDIFRLGGSYNYEKYKKSSNVSFKISDLKILCTIFKDQGQNRLLFFFGVLNK